MSVFLCVSILVLTLVGADLQASVSLRADILKNLAEVKIMLFGISIMRVRVSFSELDVVTRYVYIKINGKTLGIALTADKENKDSIFNYMSNPIMKAVDFKYFDLSVNIGRVNNPFLSAMVLQLIRTAYASFVSFIKNRQDLDTDRSFVMNYTEDSVKIDFFGIISLTLANIIFSFIVALISKIKDSLKKRRKKNDNKHRTKAY